VAQDMPLGLVIKIEGSKFHFSQKIWHIVEHNGTQKFLCAQSKGVSPLG
jgi:hypothetical protein